MKKTSLYLEDELDQALARRAADEGLSKAELIRRMLSGAMSRPKRAKPKGIGLFDSGDPDWAEKYEERMDGFGE
ncbi:MAG: CopG family transcriptional regulator [Solirubrobacterales bacterium]|nr:CopG family transcriptional regulator [Solirubrobacterales bacterium]